MVYSKTLIAFCFVRVVLNIPIFNNKILEEKHDFFVCEIIEKSYRTAKPKPIVDEAKKANEDIISTSQAMQLKIFEPNHCNIDKSIFIKQHSESSF